MTTRLQTNKPSVSVVMAVYNGGEYLPVAIESVLTQSFDSFEFIIIDDCSADGTPDVIRSFRDSRIVYIRNAENLGQTESLNVGLAVARGDFIARIDADDVWHAGKLEEQYRFMVARPDVVVCGTWADRIDATGDITGIFSPPTDPLDIRFRMLRASPVCHVSVLMRRDVIVASGGYRSRYRFAADYDLWSRLLGDGHSIVNLPVKLTQFREMPQTFGTANKIGPAGDESAEIIQSNASNLARLDLGRGQCLSIALLFFPEAELPPRTLAEAYGNLELMADATYPSLPMRVRMELLAVLFWSEFKRAALLRSKGGGSQSIRKELGGVLKAFHRRPVALIVALVAVIMSVGGADTGMRVKSWVMGCIGRLGNSVSRR